ncbi:TPA: ribonuclease Y [Candidatus Taylorbacteria bacterium]|nr:ribonuclease Y [Candidatus Taylorbacteria bacterium]
MSPQLLTIIAVLVAVAGVALGYYIRLVVSLGKRGSVEVEIKDMLLKAKEEAKRMSLDAENKAVDVMQQTRAEAKEREEKLKKAEERVIKKEDQIDEREQSVVSEIESIKQKIVEIKEIRDKTEALQATKQKELEKIAKLDESEARAILLQNLELQCEEDLLVRLHKLEQFGQDKIEQRAKSILATAIHRLGNSVPSDLMTTSVTIPNDEIKGKIIGKEGRNIKAFERMTGVEIIVDDTPGVITISSFDPIRRQIARISLELLIADGRIQPAKIEETVEKAKLLINKTIKEKGDAAVYECGIFNLDPRIVLILGRLCFRTSYGQNVLQHSIEVAHIAGMIAEELGADVQVAKAGGLLHDLGKAVDHEVQGTHVEIGRRILQKFGASEAIVKAMQAHHEEYPYETVESVIVQVADAISGSRPGARVDSLENYLKRLGDLEAIANSFTGIEKCYAIAAGREVRVFVAPLSVTDMQAHDLARNIAVKIEQELKYPGEIKITVIRESRVIEFAR